MTESTKMWATLQRPKGGRRPFIISLHASKFDADEQVKHLQVEGGDDPAYEFWVGSEAVDTTYNEGSAE